jgi:hypothetical protein
MCQPARYLCLNFTLFTYSLYSSYGHLPVLVSESPMMHDMIYLYYDVI